MKDYKFVDIGTCFYDTSLDLYGDSELCILVEPIEEFLSYFPNRSNIIKECSAIYDSEGTATINMFFVPEMLNDDLRNLKRKYKVSQSSLVRDNIIGCDKVTKRKIKTITFETLCKKHKIKSIDFLKIDAEGSDYLILCQVYEMILAEKININKIQFEMLSNLNNEKLSYELAKKFIKLGYSSSSIYYHIGKFTDITLVKE